ncbi:hypothetical protein QOT17_010616 [Balamuthia mandrillaris]
MQARDKDKPLEHLLKGLSLGGAEEKSWNVDHYNCVRQLIHPDGAVACELDVTPPLLHSHNVQVGSPVSPPAMAQSYHASFNMFHSALRKNCSSSLEALARDVRRADVQDLIQAHSERLREGQEQQETKDELGSAPVLTTRGCLYRLMNMAMENVRSNETSQVTVSVEWLPEHRAMLVIHGNPRMVPLFQEREFFNNRGFATSHLVGAIVPLMLMGEDAVFQPHEVMHVVGARCGNRKLLYWAELDGVDERGRRIEVKTRVNQDVHLVGSTKSGVVQSMLGGVDELWIYSHFTGKCQAVDKVKVPYSTGAAFCPRVAGRTLKELQDLPKEFFKGMERVEELLDRLEACVREREGIFHVNITGKELRFGESDFNKSYSYYYVNTA